MNRVVVTGLGIVSSIGNACRTVVESLRQGRSGMVYLPRLKEWGFRCCICAPPHEVDQGRFPARWRRRLSEAATYALSAGIDAVADAGLADETLHDPRMGIVFGTAISGPNYVARHDGRRAAPGEVWQMMTSSPASALAGVFGVTGRVLAISASCSTGLYNIGYAFELLRRGGLDVCLCGSAEESPWLSVGVSGDNSNGMPVHWNDQPERACRPYDRDREGFVMSAGAGALVLESLDYARRRGANIQAEVVGYGAANDAHDMFVPSGHGLRSSIQQALDMAGLQSVDYVNTHGTGTLHGDKVEADVLRDVLGGGPLVSSTKGQSGHSQGSTASQETVFTMLMLNHQFAAPTANLENIAPECDGLRHVQSLTDTPLHTAMTINSGLGGTNACLLLRRMPGE